jgi:hypothetical protein
MTRKPGKCIDCGALTSRTARVLCGRCSQRNRRASEGHVRPSYVVDDRHRSAVESVSWHLENGYVACSQSPYPGVTNLHRLVWFLEYGTVPKTLDHINRDRADNRLENLRVATPALNARNKISRGCNYRRRCLSRPFQARISRHNQNHSLGYYETPQEAEAVYRNAREIIEEFESLEALS